MANKQTDNPWTLDTAASGVVINKNYIKIRHIEMIDYTVDTDTVVLKNQLGDVIWEGNGASDLRPVRSGNIGWINGLIFESSNNAATRVRIYID
jgi:hypothetical protein